MTWAHVPATLGSSLSGAATAQPSADLDWRGGQFIATLSHLLRSKVAPSGAAPTRPENVTLTRAAVDSGLQVINIYKLKIIGANNKPTN